MTFAFWTEAAPKQNPKRKMTTLITKKLRNTTPPQWRPNTLQRKTNTNSMGKASTAIKVLDFFGKISNIIPLTWGEEKPYRKNPPNPIERCDVVDCTVKAFLPNQSGTSDLFTCIVLVFGFVHLHAEMGCYKMRNYLLSY
jgi:hypothetical protein